MTAAPSEFSTWAKLAEVYVALEQWDLALLTLNSCPMFTYQDKDTPRMPEPAKVLLPVLPESQLDEIDESSQGYDSEMIHPSLRRLHAASYKGTVLKAYSLLTEITSKIGWDQLLKIRSHVFVMEEEYRSEKQTTQQTTSQNASTTALHSPSPRLNGVTPEDQKLDGDSAEGNEKETLASFAPPAVSGESSEPGSAILETDQSLERPNHTVTSEGLKSGNEDVSEDRIIGIQLTMLMLSARLPNRQISTHNSGTRGFAKDGLTIFLWSSTKTFEFTPYGEQTWPDQRTVKKAAITANRPKNGRSLASWRKDCIISPKQSRHIRTVSGSDSAQRR